MSIALTVGCFLYRTELLPAPGGNRTYMLWVRVTNPDAYRLIYSLRDVDNTDWEDVWIDRHDPISALLTPPYIFLQNAIGSSFTGLRGHTPVVADTWVHVAVTSASGGTHRLYINGTLFSGRIQASGFGDMGAGSSYSYTFSTATTNREAIGHSDLSIHPDTHGGSPTATAMEVKEFRQWSAILTAGEIATEMAASSAVRTLNLFADTPLTSYADLTDHSGNGRHWIPSCPPPEPEPEPTTVPPIANAIESCSSTASPATTDPGELTPELDPTVPVGDWTEQCEGDGTVPVGGAGSVGDDTWN